MSQHPSIQYVTVIAFTVLSIHKQLWHSVLVQATTPPSAITPPTQSVDHSDPCAADASFSETSHAHQLPKSRQLIGQLKAKSVLARVRSSVLLVGYSWRTVTRILDWQDEETLFIAAQEVCGVSQHAYTICIGSYQ